MSSVSLIDGHIDEPRMIDNEIISALECCNEMTASECSECPLLNVDCSEYDLYKLALDLIKRKQAVNELQAKEIVDLKIKVKEQRAEIERLKEKNKSIRYCYEQAKSYNDTLAESCEKNCKKFNMTTRAEVIKEFWGKTKKYFKKNICFFTPEDESELIQYGDNLAKEMVGE